MEGKVTRTELNEDAVNIRMIMEEIRGIAKEILKSLGHQRVIEVGDESNHSSFRSTLGAGIESDEQKSAVWFDDAGAIQGTIRHTPNIPIEILSQEELQRQRDNGLCYHCDEVYKFGHRCNSRQVYISKAMTDGGGKGVLTSCDVVKDIQDAEEEEGEEMHTTCSTEVLQEMVYGTAEEETENEHATCSIKVLAKKMGTSQQLGNDTSHIDVPYPYIQLNNAMARGVRCYDLEQIGSYETPIGMNCQSIEKIHSLMNTEAGDQFITSGEFINEFSMFGKFSMDYRPSLLGQREWKTAAAGLQNISGGLWSGSTFELLELLWDPGGKWKVAENDLVGSLPIHNFKSWSSTRILLPNTVTNNSSTFSWNTETKLLSIIRKEAELMAVSRFPNCWPSTELRPTAGFQSVGQRQSTAKGRVPTFHDKLPNGKVSAGGFSFQRQGPLFKGRHANGRFSNFPTTGLKKARSSTAGCKGQRQVSNASFKQLPISKLQMARFHKQNVWPAASCITTFQR